MILDCRKVGITSSFSFFFDLAKRLFMSETLREANAFVRKEYLMREFDYSKLKERIWDNEIMAYVAQIHEFKGKQDLFLRQKPVGLNRLVEIAKLQSTES